MGRRKIINEAIFCEEFLSKHKIIFSGGSFFTAEGRVVDELPLRRMVFDDLKICAVSNVPQKISNIVELLKIQALDETFAPETDRIHLEDDTLYFNGCFVDIKASVPCGNGAILCMRPKLSAINSENFIVPIRMI